MCRNCWTVAGSPYDLPENAAEIVDAINDLYDLPDCGAGGPLHVQLDDWNVELDWKPWPGPEREPWPPEAMEQAQLVADLMVPLPVSQRYAVLAKWHGWLS